jgi:hypothetical protein
MIEHRWSQHVEVCVEARIIDADHGTCQGIIRNFSLFGVYVETYEPYPEHAFLHLRFALPDGPDSDIREISGVVIHSDDTGMGMMVDTTAVGAAQTLRDLKRRYAKPLFSEDHLLSQ